MTQHRSFRDEYEFHREQCRRRARAYERQQRIDPADTVVWTGWTSSLIATGPADGVDRALTLRGWRWAFGSFWLIGHSAGAFGLGRYPAAAAWACVVLGVAVAGVRVVVRRSQTAIARLDRVEGAPPLPRLDWPLVLRRTLPQVAGTTVACWALAVLGAAWVSSLLLFGYLGMHVWAAQRLPRADQLVYLCRRNTDSGEWFLGTEYRQRSTHFRQAQVREVGSDELVETSAWCASLHWPPVPPLRCNLTATPDLIVPLPVGFVRPTGDRPGGSTNPDARAVGPGRRSSRSGPEGAHHSTAAGPANSHRLPEDALAVLGLEAHATPWEARLAHRRLAKEHHPDRGGDPERFRAIQDAWERIVTASPPSP